MKTEILNSSVCPLTTEEIIGIMDKYCMSPFPFFTRAEHACDFVNFCESYEIQIDSTERVTALIARAHERMKEAGFVVFPATRIERNADVHEDRMVFLFGEATL
ncbi:hypothetical protein EBT31_15670 [bacterium]|jgi:hypothetical protein|nr:hypothetical protein [bacterium]